MPGNKKNKRKAAQKKKAAAVAQPAFQNPNTFDPKAIKGGKGGGPAPALSNKLQRTKGSQRGR